MTILGIRSFALAAGLVAAASAVAGGCGGKGGSPSSGSGGTSSGNGGGGAAESTSSHSGSTGSDTTNSTSSTSGSDTTSSTSTGGGGNPAGACTTTAKGATRGSAIALASDDSMVVAVNRDVGSVTVMSVDFADGQPAMKVVSEIAVGGEPWQVVMDACNTTAYVVLRKDQKVVEITDLKGSPKKGRSVNVGSEPTSLALTPNNTKLYVSNWVDGTLSVIDPVSMTATGTIDLNTTIAGTGLLGTVTPRAALAHPRGIAITNNGDAKDDDETVYATEWFAVRTGPEDATGTNSDHNWKGLLYKIGVATGTPSTLDLPPIVDTGFKDINDASTGCFPNQVASVTIDGGFAYVTSTCASPVGPIGVFTGKNAGGACTVATQTADCGAGGTCNATTLVCAPNTRGVKTTTHPAVTILDLTSGNGSTTNLDKLFDAKTSARVPLLPTDIDFRPGFAYVAAEGADALFRLVIANGTITDVGSASNNFIDLRTAADATIRLPIGVAVSKNKGFAFAANDGNRDVTAVDLNAQAVAGNPATSDFRVTHSSALPTANPDLSALKGKRFFNTGLGRWSLAGAGWGSCGACHIDGLTDNVTWYFARGPRQTTSLDGTFSKSDPTDQRILNWTAINDEIADFEGNTRGISGGVGALVTKNSAPPAVGDRIDTASESPPQQGLQGSSTDAASASGSAHPHSVDQDWLDITNWVKTVRSPKKPSNLVTADVTAGKAIFGDPAQGNCIGCHSGSKWTISKVFYTPNDTFNDASAAPAGNSLSLTTWNTGLNGFPAALFPATAAANQMMRFGLAPAAEQMQCVLRPVGTIKPPATAGGVPVGVSDPKVNVLELRQDMKTGGQGASDPGLGFNPPSLLGLQVGAPYFHAGNARTLEESFNAMFAGHHQSALAQVFAPDATQVKQLVAYLLSIDASEAPFAIPAKGAKGGDLCFHN